jgi:hypothetical protein
MLAIEVGALLQDYFATALLQLLLTPTACIAAPRSGPEPKPLFVEIERAAICAAVPLFFHGSVGCASLQ